MNESAPGPSIETEKKGGHKNFELDGVNYSVEYELVEPYHDIGEKPNNEIKITKIENHDTYEDVSLDSKVVGPLTEMAQKEYNAYLKETEGEFD